MEKNGNGATTTPPNSMGVCKKIFNAITISPAFRTIRQITRSASPSPARDTSHAAVKTTVIKSKPQAPAKSSEATDKVIQVPIKFEASHVHLQEITKTTNVDAPVQEEPKPKEDLAQKKVVGVDHCHGQDAKEEKDKKPKYYSKSEAPVKEAAENIEGNNNKKHAGVDENGDDIFSEYIIQKKKKIRTLSSKKISELPDDDDVNGGKRKESVKDHFSDYIHRVKNKFKSTPSNLGKENNISFKRE